MNPNFLKQCAVILCAAFSLMTASSFAAPNPEKDVFFGETHVHTSWSFDAYTFGNTLTGPEDAYKYALGQPIKHPAGYDVKITKPLDFMGVTDHSEYCMLPMHLSSFDFMGVTDHAEYVGALRLANDPESPLANCPSPKN